MIIGTLYKLCLKKIFRHKTILFDQIDFFHLPKLCLEDLLIYFSPIELERFDSFYVERQISINQLWRHHFQLIWSLSRDDKDAYESNLEIPYKRLYFEYLFHDTEILQLTIYTEFPSIDRAQSITNISLFEQIDFKLTRDSIIYSSKRRFYQGHRKHLLISWNQRWNQYVHRFTLVPNVFNVSQIDRNLIECFYENVNNLVLSGFPTENDGEGMKLILDLFTRGRIDHLVLKFPSFCLINVVLPLFIFPRQYNLSYFSPFKIEENPTRSQRRACFRVEVQDEFGTDFVQRLTPLLNRWPSARGSSRSEQMICSSGSNLFQSTKHSSKISSISSKSNDVPILHIRPEIPIHLLTRLSIFYVSSIEIIELVAVALSGMTQIRHLTLVNFAQYSSQLEQTLVTLCVENQLESLQLTSLTFLHGAIGFLVRLFQHRTDRTIHLKRLRLDATKSSMETIDSIDLERTQWFDNVSLEHLNWRERQMQLVHMRLLNRLIPTVLPRLRRLELSSMLECYVLDQYHWCRTFLNGINDVRLRNFRLRSNNISSLFISLNHSCLLTVFHFERVGFIWTNDVQSITIEQAFRSLIFQNKNLLEFSLAYNNLNEVFIRWLCELFSSETGDDDEKKISSWSIVHLNLTFNLISSTSMQRFVEVLNEYRIRWRLRYVPLRRIDIFGNAIDAREINSLKQQFQRIGCELNC